MHRFFFAFYFRLRIIALGLALLLASPGAFAAYNNYSSVLIGERAAGLGGAFTALAGDAAATPFYNPATSVLQEGSSASGSVHVYNKYATNIGQPGDFQGAAGRLNRGFFRSLPSSSGTILNFDQKFTLGLSIVVPDYDFYSGQVKGVDDSVSSLNFVDESLWVGGTASKKLSSVDSIGVSLYYTARNVSRSVNDRTTNAGGTASTIVIEEKNLTSNNLVFVVGYHRRLSNEYSVGLSYRPPSLQVAGEGSYYRSTTVTSPYTDDVINRGGLKAMTEIPARFSIGIAREIPKLNTITLDAQIYSGANYHDLPDFDTGTDYVNHHYTANIAAGYEHILQDWLTVRGGVFTNLSSSDPIDPASTHRSNDHVNMYGFSANFSIRAHQQTSFTFGGYYSGGAGISTQLVGNQIRVIPKSQQIFTMLVGSSFHF